MAVGVEPPPQPSATAAFPSRSYSPLFALIRYSALLYSKEPCAVPSCVMWVDHKFDQLGVAGFPKYIEPVIIKTAQNPHVKSTINKFLHSPHNVTHKIALL